MHRPRPLEVAAFAAMVWLGGVACGPADEKAGDVGVERGETGVSDAGADADAGPGETATMTFDPQFSKSERYAITINVYDDETGRFVGGIWRAEAPAGEEWEALEIRGADEDACVTDQTAELPLGAYEAYFAIETGSSITVNQPLDACGAPSSEGGFIERPDAIARYDIDLSEDHVEPVEESDFEAPAEQTLRVEGSMADDGARLGCLWRHPELARGGFETAMLSKRSANLTDGAATFEQPNVPILPKGQYRVVCIADVNGDNYPGEGDEKISTVLEWDDETEVLDSWSAVE